MADLVSQLELRHLARIIESSDDAIVSKDLDGTIRSWNRAAERIFGFSAAEVIGRSIRIIIPADRQSEEDEVLERIRRGQEVSHFETIRQRKDGTVVQVSLTVSPIRDEAGTVIGASKIARDITERSGLRLAALEQSLITEKLGQVGAAVASSLDRGTIVQQVTDLATSLTHAEWGAFVYNVDEPHSGEAYSLYALSGEATDAIEKLSPPGAGAAFASTLRDGAGVRVDDVTQVPGEGQAERYRAALDRAPVRSYLAVPVKTASGEVLGGLFFGHATPGVFTEQHERLVAGIAGWASLALENSRMYGLAREADRLKDEFLAVLSHELRTPLNAILGYARLLRGGILTGEKAERGLETLERNASSLTQIVDDVLDVSRIISGKIRLEVQPVELALVIDNAVATVQPAADARGIQIQTTVDRHAGPVSGDPDRLGQVVWNLLSNAVKFTSRGGRVQVHLERVESHIDVVVSDTGQGIRRDFLPHVFERFRQAEGGTTRQTSGLGLGLSIVRHIVEMHGGSVEASSEGEGRGSTFRVRLPLTVVPPQEVEKPRERPFTARLPKLTGLSGLAGVRVLAIDDEADALGLLRVVLEAAGAEVSTLSSAVAALDQIEALAPHALVVDLAMPQMDGFEFIARLRASANAHVRDVPAAALTAFARSDERTRALQSGFEMHLAKPVDPGELVASVAALVKRASRKD